ncbi:MAG TPA: DUF4390 domain-containing protein [Thermoanaerobaculia bacterium]|nr:DUF4390 domain-containing protein [Thermoanaerobaculia bacterium]
MRRLLILFLAAGLFSGTLRADSEARIVQLKGSAGGSHVSVTFQLENGFSRPEILDALRSGVSTGFTYHFELIRKRPNWFDQRISTATVEVIATYNSITQEYLLNYRRNRRLIRTEVFTRFDALEREMTVISETHLLPLEGRRPEKVRVRVRADLMQGYLLHIVPWNISTGWEQARVGTAR